MIEQKDLRNMLRELFEADEGLSNWETKDASENKRTWRNKGHWF